MKWPQLFRQSLLPSPSIAVSSSIITHRSIAQALGIRHDGVDSTPSDRLEDFRSVKTDNVDSSFVLMVIVLSLPYRSKSRYKGILWSTDEDSFRALQMQLSEILTQIRVEYIFSIML